jgi:hypothetical protein
VLAFCAANYNKAVCKAQIPIRTKSLAAYLRKGYYFYFSPLLVHFLMFAITPLQHHKAAVVGMQRRFVARRTNN